MRGPRQPTNCYVIVFIHLQQAKCHPYENKIKASTNHKQIRDCSHSILACNAGIHVSRQRTQVLVCSKGIKVTFLFTKAPNLRCCHVLRQVWVNPTTKQALAQSAAMHMMRQPVWLASGSCIQQQLSYTAASSLLSPLTLQLPQLALSSGCISWILLSTEWTTISCCSSLHCVPQVTGRDAPRHPDMASPRAAFALCGQTPLEGNAIFTNCTCISQAFQNLSSLGR